tara:strand:+ start:124 stop:1029 length:906 start_codon:yes stop_codon:yes gene_type:complete
MKKKLNKQKKLKLSKKRHIILIPVYNDEKSLNKLLIKIDSHLDQVKNFRTEILILDDKSTDRINLDNKKFKNLKKISILTVKENLGSQKIIAVGLNYLTKIKENFFITVMDSDGEDNPVEIERMLELASKNADHVITSNRKDRKESLLIKFLYKSHLLITFFFSLKWISFGNFTTFNSKNIEKILSDTSSWLAHSSSVIKNCKIKRVYARRDKRYFDKSKLSLLKLIEHSIRVNAVFAKRVLISSVVYISFIYFIFGLGNLLFLISLGIIFFNLLIFLIRIKHLIKNYKICDNIIENYKSF